ncbi:UNVERIFIED_CONTAM: hypothetical protein HDU68_010880 [Siphonaria sp. JEL0065]|nr:hypothetical protein HDU68_010880 [Siphonaria sp. JEL0065]
MEITLATFFADPTANQAQTVTALSSVPLLQVVQSIGDKATASDPFERAKAIALLSLLLRENVATDKKTVLVLLEFYLARLHDVTSVPELTSGILSMVQTGLLGRPEALEIARSFFKELNVQNQPQNVRFTVYCIFEALLKSHLDERESPALKYLGPQFIAGFLVAMDGEKDPRNILISFSIIQTIIVNFDITTKFEDVFEAVYCYFPITFRPPPNDPYGITSADLKLKLRNCFSASPLFGKLAWPILIEKLSSTSDNAKLDAMETIAACAPVYGGSSIGRNLEELWEHLKEESLDSKPQAQKEAALSAITAVTYALSTDAGASSVSSDGFTKFLTFVQKYSIGELINTTTPKDSVRKVLKASAKATEPSFFYLVSHVMKPFLDSLKGNADSTESRAEKYGVFYDFLELSEGFYGNVSAMDDDSLPQNPLVPFKDELYQYFSSALSSKNNRVITAGLHGLAQLSILRGGFLTAQELEWYFETLLGLVVNENNAVRQVVISLLIIESGRRLDKVLQYIVPQLLEACVLVGAGREEIVLNSLECLVAISGASSVVLGEVITRLAKLVEELNSLVLIHPIINAIEIIFAQETKSVVEFDSVKNLFIPLLRALVARQVGGVWLYSHLDFVESVGRTFSSVVRVLDRSVQETVAGLVVKSLYIGDLSDLGLAGFTVSIQADSSTKQLAIVFSAVLSNLRADALIPNTDVSSLLNQLTQESVFKGPVLENVKEVYLESLYHVVASLLNKGDASLVSRFNSDNATLYKLVEKVEDAQSVKSHKAAVNLVLWITRAAIMKKPGADELAKATQLIQLLKGADGEIVASHFFILSADDASFGKHVLTKDSFAKQSLLWKQKLFKHCMPILVDGFNKSSDDIKSNHLLSLSHLMKYVSKSVILYEIQNLIPLLLAGLTSQNDQLKHTILEIVFTLLTDTPASLQAHLDSFTTSLLRLVGGDLDHFPSSSTHTTNSTDVKVLALKCLGKIPKTELPFNELFVLKPRVIRGLQVPLDDSKKSVRREAGNARAKWYLLLGGK